MKSIPWLCWILIFYLSCAPDKQSGQTQLSTSTPYNHISFNVDSIKTIVFDSLNSGTFIFSPIEEKDHVWYFGGTNKYDINLLTNERVLLEKKYPTLDLSQVDPLEIWKDSIRSEVFIASFHGKKFIRYNTLENKTYNYPISSVTSCINSNNILLVGTASGLFIVDKNSGHFHRSLDVPIELWVKDMEVKGDNILINEGIFTFSLALEQPISWTRPTFHLSQDIYNIEKLLPGGNHVFYKPQIGTDFYLFSSEDRIFYLDSSRFLYEVNFLPRGLSFTLLSDDQYWYVLYPQKIMIINRQYVLQKSKPYYFMTYQGVLDSCRKRINALYNLSIDDFLSQFQIINADSSCLSLDEYQTLIERAVYNYFKNSMQIDQLIKYYYQKQLPRGVEAYAINALIIYYTHQFDDKKVRELIKSLYSKYPEYKYYWMDGDLVCINKIFDSVDSLRKFNLPLDEYLFKEAKIRERLVKCGGFGDSYYDFSLVEANYQRIVEEFPNSPYAEEVDFYHAGSEGLDPENGYPETMEGLVSLDAFKLKYPNSRFEGKIDARKAFIMSNYYQDYDSTIWYKERALDILHNINPKYFEDTLFRNEVKYQILDLEHRIIKMYFDFTITMRSDKYSGDDVIDMHIRLYNKTDKPRRARIFTSKTKFILELWSDNGVEMESPINSRDTTSKEIVIPPSGSIEEDIKFPALVRIFNYPDFKYQNMTIKNEGLYKFAAKMPGHEELYSNVVAFYYQK